MLLWVHMYQDLVQLQCFPPTTYIFACTHKVSPTRFPPTTYIFACTANPTPSNKTYIFACSGCRGETYTPLLHQQTQSCQSQTCLSIMHCPPGGVVMVCNVCCLCCVLLVVLCSACCVVYCACGWLLWRLEYAVLYIATLYNILCNATHHTRNTQHTCTAKHTQHIHHTWEVMAMRLVLACTLISL